MEWIILFRNRGSKESRNIRLFRKQKQKYLKKRWEGKRYTNLKTDSYVNKNVISIYNRKGIKEKRERSVVNSSRPKSA